MSLAGKVALVTGSTSGIGAGIARALAAAGADIALNGFGEPAEVARIEQEIAAFGVRAVHLGADLAEGAQAAALVALAAERLGTVDILVNNGGIQHVAPLESFDPSRWDAVLAVNLSAVFHTMRAAIPAMRARRWGRIINIASAHGLVASPQKSAYVAAKHGVVGLTRVAAAELAGDGITCNAICPGWVLTPLVEAQIAARAAAAGRPSADIEAELLGEKQPLRRFTTPEQIGALAVFLCGEAAATITGAPLPIDGGWTAV